MSQSHIEVLLVEDNMDEAVLILRTLKKCHEASHIKHLKDGVEAIDFLFNTSYLQKAESLPQLILLDVNMPRVSGLEVLDRIKADDRTRAIPVIVMVSSHTTPDVQKCLAKGANGYIIKPVTLDQYTVLAQQLGVRLSKTH